MKKLLSSLFLFVFILGSAAWGHADGLPEESAPVKKYHSRGGGPVAEEPAPPPATCIAASDHKKVHIISANPVQKISKILGVLQECVTTQWDVLRILSGPNTIGLHYPEEKEMWGYSWLWSYQLRNPIEDTLIFMDKSGKRIQKGKDPVLLYLTFNKEDVLERIEMVLFKKKNSQYMVYQ